MISRKTNLFIAKLIISNFVESVRKQRSSMYGHSGGTYYSNEIQDNKLRDFLYLAGVDEWSIKKIYNISYPGNLENELLGMETGMFYNSTDYKKHKGLGQKDLRAIATALLCDSSKYFSNNIQKEEFENSLRIDGYIFSNGSLYEVNLDIENKKELMLVLFDNMKLDNQKELEKFYQDMNEHYENSKWEDSIHNGRKVFELTLMSVATHYSQAILKDNEIKGNEKPINIRLYLEDKQFFSKDELNVIQYYYGYISNIGSHPKLALKEQADFCRVMTINTCLYALKRLESYAK